VTEAGGGQRDGKKFAHQRMNKGLSLVPQYLGAHDWYYETNGEIELFHEVLMGEHYCRTDRIKIPWRKLRASLKRKDENLHSNAVRRQKPNKKTAG
jgi:hypothetical protein